MDFVEFIEFLFKSIRSHKAHFGIYSFLGQVMEGGLLRYIKI